MLEKKIDELSGDMLSIRQAFDALVSAINNNNRSLLAVSLAKDNKLNSNAVCKVLNITPRHLQRIKKDIPMKKEGSRLVCLLPDLLVYCHRKKVS